MASAVLCVTRWKWHLVVAAIMMLMGTLFLLAGLKLRYLLLIGPVGIIAGLLILVRIFIERNQHLTDSTEGDEEKNMSTRPYADEPPTYDVAMNTPQQSPMQSTSSLHIHSIRHTPLQSTINTPQQSPLLHALHQHAAHVHTLQCEHTGTPRCDNIHNGVEDPFDRIQYFNSEGSLMTSRTFGESSDTLELPPAYDEVRYITTRKYSNPPCDTGF